MRIVLGSKYLFDLLYAEKILFTAQVPVILGAWGFTEPRVGEADQNYARTMVFFLVAESFAFTDSMRNAATANILRVDTRPEDYSLVKIKEANE